MINQFASLSKYQNSSYGFIGFKFFLQLQKYRFNFKFKIQQLKKKIKIQIKHHFQAKGVLKLSKDDYKDFRNTIELQNYISNFNNKYLHFQQTFPPNSNFLQIYCLQQHLSIIILQAQNPIKSSQKYQTLIQQQKLNIYDLSPANYYLHSIGVGAYHTGVQINSTEYSFGYHDGSSTGVFGNDPSEVNNGMTFRQKRLMGDCRLSKSQIEDIIEDLKTEYIGCSYDIFRRNCNHFSNDLCKKLLGKGIPGYINRLSYLANTFRCCVPKQLLQGPQQQNQQKEDSVMIAKKKMGKDNFQAFSGKSTRIGSSLNSSTNTENAKFMKFFDLESNSSRGSSKANSNFNSAHK